MSIHLAGDRDPVGPNSCISQIITSICVLGLFYARLGSLTYEIQAHTHMVLLMDGLVPRMPVASVNNIQGLFLTLGILQLSDHLLTLLV